MDTMVIDMSKQILEGDVLDIGGEDYNVIYNAIKCVEDEISIDYVEDGACIEPVTYDSCVFFLTLGKIYSKKERERLIKQPMEYLKQDGYIYIWDILKVKNEKIDYYLKILMPDDRIKVVRYENKNVFIDNLEKDIKTLVSKYYDIVEVKTNDRVIFIKAKRRETVKNEGIINSDKLKIYPQ